MKKYEVEVLNTVSTWVTVLEINRKCETMIIEITDCTNPGGKNSLPYLWHKAGFTDKVLETYLGIHCYVENGDGNCSNKYNPMKLDKGGINFEWLLENTPENKQKIINKCIELFEFAN